MRFPSVALTRRQREVLELYAEGLSDLEIGGRLGVAASTVRSHIASICNRLGANHRFQCGVLAERYGIFPTNPPLT